MPEKKQEIFAKYGKSNKDTGSPESQVALFSYRIAHLTEHVKKNKKDVVTRRSLLRLLPPPSPRTAVPAPYTRQADPPP